MNDRADKVSAVYNDEHGSLAVAAPHHKKLSSKNKGRGQPSRQRSGRGNPGPEGRPRRKPKPQGRSEDRLETRSRRRRGQEAGSSRSRKRASGPRRSGGGAEGEGKPKGGKGAGPRRRPARGPGGKPFGSRRSDSAPSRGRHESKGGRSGGKPDRKPLPAGAGPDNLPRWMREEIRLTTRKDRQTFALKVIAEGIDEYGDENFEAAFRKLAKAKQLSPRSPSVRELLGLSAYRLERWGEALAELRAYRRIAGDTSYMPAEMDSLRALGRDADVEKTWKRFGELGGSRPAEAEARVVYGAFLLDRGRPAEAWAVTRTSRLPANAPLYELRRWFIAARAALEIGDAEAAGKLARAVHRAEPRIEGLDELMSLIDSVDRP